MDRNKAISYIAENNMKYISDADFDSFLLDFWCLDEEDEEFHILSKDLQIELISFETPPKYNNKEKYKPIVLLALEDELKGVSNAYLRERLIEIFEDNTIEVNGPIEKMYPCPCCSFLTLSGRGDYEICPVCFWEDDGSDDIGSYSPCNHMFLKDGRSNFARFGTVDQDVEFRQSANERRRMFPKKDSDI